MPLDPPTGMTYGTRPAARSPATTSATTASSRPTASIGSIDGTSLIDAPYSLSSSRLPAIGGALLVTVSTSTATHPGDARSRGGHARVVRLHRAGRDERRRAFLPCVGDEVLELARLVAARPSAVRSSRLIRMRGQAFAPPSASRSRRRFLQRRRQRRKRHAGPGRDAARTRSITSPACPPKPSRR